MHPPQGPSGKMFVPCSTGSWQNLDPGAGEGLQWHPRTLAKRDGKGGHSL